MARSPKSDPWPLARSRWCEAAAESAGSIVAKSAARLDPNSSNVPHFTRLSRIFLFTVRESKREQKSSSDE
jgi:hypothetical protein